MQISIMPQEGCTYGNELVQELLKMRQENGKPMTQYRIARALSLTDQAVYKWVKGESSPLRENFDKLVQYKRFLEFVNQKRPFGK